MKENRLSILIPAIPDRISLIDSLYNKLNDQIKKYDCSAIDVEIIVFMDNKIRTIGEKRNDILKLATGNYVIQLDDDDDIGNNFIQRICDAIVYYKTDVITFNQLAIINNEYSIVKFRLNNDLEPFYNCGITNRPVWHCCVIKKQIALRCAFNSYKNWGEDKMFSDMINMLAKTEHYIDEVLHIYNHQDKNTASFIENNIQ